MIKSVSWVLGFLLLGEALALLVPVPGSVLGMVLLAVALGQGLVPEEEVRPAAELLVGNMAFFFVPSGVAVLATAGSLSSEWLPLLGASLVSTLAVMVTVGLIQQRGEAR
jgi:holin-like protein